MGHCHHWTGGDGAVDGGDRVVDEAQQLAGRLLGECQPAVKGK
jgi:hypothetical protein